MDESTDYWLGVISVLALFAFIWTEAHVAAPMVPLALFKDRQFNGAALATVLSGVFYGGIVSLNAELLHESSR